MAAILTNIGNSIFEAATNTHQNALEQFLNKFSSSPKLVDQIDPLASFEVFMKFFPSIASQNSNKPKIIESNNFEDQVKKYSNNFLNNASGGLYNSIMNRDPEEKINTMSLKDAKKNFQINDGKAKKHSFLEYIAKSTLLVGSENYGREEKKQLIIPLELQLGYYVQSITIPKIKIADEKSTTYLGDFILNTGAVIPDNNMVIMDILCTKLPLHERIFYPWMREVTMPFWSYDTQPYSTATITIDFSKHTDIQYVFTGCRPIQIESIQPTQAINDALTRQVTFAFDFMFITSKELPILSEKKDDNERLIASGKTIFNTVNKFI